MPPSSCNKKRKATSATEEVVFDESARSTYLTGFHKRKQARIAHAREVAALKEKEERRRDKAELKKQRIEEVEAHVKAVDEAFKTLNGFDESEDDDDEEDGEEEEEEWEGIEEETDTKAEWEEEYIDEGKYTTVSVEEVGISKDGFVNLEEERQNGLLQIKKTTEAKEKAKEAEKAEKAKRKKKADKSTKRKKRSFRYENKEDRDKNNMKERARKKAQAMDRKGKR